MPRYWDRTVVVIYEQPTPCMRGPGVLTLDDMVARYQEAHIWFDTQCPHLAHAPDLVFREMEPGSKLTAIARATGAYLELIRGTSKSYRRAVRDNDANWIERNSAHWQMRARWIPAISTWVRYTTSVATKPRRCIERPYPVVGVDVDVELEPVPAFPKLTLARRSVLNVRVAPDSPAIQVGDAVAVGSDGFVRRVADVGEVVTYEVEVVGPSDQPGTVLVRFNF